MGGIISETGDIWPEEYPLVISGHIHDFQIPQKNIIYTGTPYQQGYNDSAEKGLLLLKINENSYEYERINLEVIKKKIFNMSLEEFIDYVPSESILSKIIIEGDPKTIREALKRKDIQSKITNNKIVYRIKDIKVSKPNIKINNNRITFNYLIDILKTELGVDILDEIINQ